ncbi:hypothetical protein PR202_ga03529 [Eleusine coracana subsp. coracana]|uniref:Uncharacterized protein n=1 Tax=Eleusine coracana subsp. coracana TaxID=191504 RepID=A0AAV5BNR3_ELECO|nr:hypothetical protein PR202_ga03529 [Eleusine coracana subsp. coracana]
MPTESRERRPYYPGTLDPPGVKSRRRSAQPAGGRAPAMSRSTPRGVEAALACPQRFGRDSPRSPLTALPFVLTKSFGDKDDRFVIAVVTTVRVGARTTEQALPLPTFAE